MGKTKIKICGLKRPEDNPDRESPEAGFCRVCICGKQEKN